MLVSRSHRTFRLRRSSRTRLSKNNFTSNLWQVYEPPVIYPKNNIECVLSLCLRDRAAQWCRRATRDSRIHHQWQPRMIFADDGISYDTKKKLEEYGHKITDFEHYSSVQVVHFDEKASEFFGASDPRKGGWPQ